MEVYKRLCVFFLRHMNDIFVDIEAEKVAFLLGVNCSDMLRSLMTPKVKVGSEYVTKGQSKDQVHTSISLERPILVFAAANGISLQHYTNLYFTRQSRHFLIV